LPVYGGYNAVEGDRNDVWHFSRSGGTWRQLVPAVGDVVPAPRSGHSAVALDPAGTKFMIFGGNMRNDMWEFDVTTGKWRELMEQMVTSAARGLTHGAGATLTATVMACAALMITL